MLKQIVKFAVVCSIALSCQAAMADCGKMWIYPYNWGNYWSNNGWQSPDTYGGTHLYGEPDYQQLMNRNKSQSSSDSHSTQTTVVNTGSEEVEKLRKELADIRKLITELTNRIERSSYQGTKSPTGTGTSTPEKPITSGRKVTSNTGKKGFVEKPKGGGASAGYFNEPQQQAVISWNGREDEYGRETLILTTNEESVDGSKGYLLSVLPLPGEPEKVELANLNVFVEAKALFYSKTPEPKPRNGADCGVVLESKIGPHNIFVWELDDVESFQTDVQAWVAERFESGAAALITDEAVDVLQYYFERGFRYFAFDLTEVGRESTKQAIAYTFQSSHVYYPLVISRIGGSDDYSLVDLIIMTPGIIHLNGAITEVLREDEEITSDNQATLMRNGSVSFSIDEVESLDPSLNVFDSDIEEVTVRNIQFYQILNGFTQDFTAVATVDEE